MLRILGIRNLIKICKIDQPEKENSILQKSSDAFDRNWIELRNYFYSRQYSEYLVSLYKALLQKFCYLDKNTSTWQLFVGVLIFFKYFKHTFHVLCTFIFSSDNQYTFQNVGCIIWMALTKIYGFHPLVYINMQNMVRQQKGKPRWNINY